MTTPSLPRLAPIPAGLPDAVPFVGPETLERRRGAPFRARLGANENGFGPSPAAVQAMRDAAAEAWKYGDPTSHDLRAALAQRHGVTPDHIVVGEGIDALHLPRLTERFYRVDNHRSREQGGTGLGLAIVKHIINRHRGRLRIESEKGHGSRFTVILPEQQPR